MKILIVAATQMELKMFYEHFNFPKRNFVPSEKFDLLITGVGMVATAFALGKYLTANYDFVLNVGIGGSFNKLYPLGTLVEINKDIFNELGAQDGESFISIDEMGFGKSTYFSKHQLALNLPIVSALTCNTVTGNDTTAQSLIQQYQPTIESMEGAAVFFAAQQLGVNCVQVRAISNYVEKRNRQNWKIDLALDHLNRWLIQFVIDMN